jgi:soluble lytic murein transglycosylase
MITVVSGREVTLTELNSYPKSIAKDFYIWQFLQQDSTSKNDAEKAFSQVSRVTGKIKKAYKRKGGIEQLTLPDCKIYPVNTILGENNISMECIKDNLTPKRLSLLNGEQLQKIIHKFKKESDRYISLLTMAIYYSQDIEKTLYANPEIFLDIFLRGSSELKESSKINRKLTTNFLNKLVKYKSKFEKFVANVIAYDGKYKALKESLLALQPSNDMSIKTLSYLAFNLIQSGKDREALPFFQIAKKVGWYQIDRDRATFWLYLISKDKNYLKELLNSWDINIYTIYAREELNKPVAKNIIHQDKLYSYNDLFTSKVNPSSPFDWIEVKEQIFKYQKGDNSDKKLFDFANLFKTEEHLGIYFYIMERGHRFRKQSFPTPYRKYMKELSVEDQAMIYSIARQESKFIPSVISTSYALGMMQIMPFLVEDIAKRKGETIELESMFNPVKNLEYSIFHLQTLQKEFISPLFIAYAYNGGGGFTRRMLKADGFPKGKYEPFLSMETLSYHETRKYGKKVLANYVVYRRLLGKPVSLHELLDDVMSPEKSDYVRKR